jgi:outer membrane biosynthesis protein TonB
VFAAIAALAFAAWAVIFTVGGGLRPAGDLEPASGTLGAAMSAGSDQGGLQPASSVGVAGPTSSSIMPLSSPTIESEGPSVAPTPSAGIVDGQPTPPPTPEPVPTPTPTPRPTPTPTPRPTPTPTPRPTPTPTPCTLAAPDLLGLHKNQAAASWSTAGFTGVVNALPGPGNYVIQSQNLTAGQMYPCDASVTVGP